MYNLNWQITERDQQGKTRYVRYQYSQDNGPYTATVNWWQTTQQETPQPTPRNRKRSSRGTHMVGIQIQNNLRHKLKLPDKTQQCNITFTKTKTKHIHATVYYTDNHPLYPIINQYFQQQTPEKPLEIKVQNPRTQELHRTSYNDLPQNSLWATVELVLQHLNEVVA